MATDVSTMSQGNRRAAMERKRNEFLQAFEEDVEQCSQSVDVAKSLSEQDQRLTTKHIKTLTFLQDIVNENKTLKARNDQLETDLSECEALHQLAREAPEKLKAMQREYIQKMDEINDMLLQKHQTELTRVVNEKQQLEQTWQTEKSNLEKEVSRLKASLSSLTANLTQERQNSDRAQMIQLKLDALSEENAFLKDEQTKYLAENENLCSEVQSLLLVRQRNEKLQADLTSVHQTCKELQLKNDNLSKNAEQNQTGKPHLMEQAKNKLSKLSQEKRLLQDRCQNLEQEIELLCARFDEEKERTSVLDQYIERLQCEITSLREELLRKSRPSGDRDFREFVQVKRELRTLKEENEELTSKIKAKQRNRAQSLLPALKGAEAVERRLSAGSVLSKK